MKMASQGLTGTVSAGLPLASTLAPHIRRHIGKGRKTEDILLAKKIIVETQLKRYYSTVPVWLLVGIKSLAEIKSGRNNRHILSHGVNDEKSRRWSKRK